MTDIRAHLAPAEASTLLDALTAITYDQVAALTTERGSRTVPEWCGIASNAARELAVYFSPVPGADHAPRANLDAIASQVPTITGTSTPVTTSDGHTTVMVPTHQVAELLAVVNASTTPKSDLDNLIYDAYSAAASRRVNNDPDLPDDIEVAQDIAYDATDARAADTNNDGPFDQIASLIAEYGYETARTTTIDRFPAASQRCALTPSPPTRVFTSQPNSRSPPRMSPRPSSTPWPSSCTQTIPPGWAGSRAPRRPLSTCMETTSSGTARRTR